MVWLLLILIPLAMPFAARGQEWQAYQLTHYPDGAAVYSYDVAVDSNENIHLYYLADLNIQEGVNRAFYSRFDVYGNTLTDSIVLDAQFAPHPLAYYMAAGTDANGGTWGVWSDGPAEWPYHNRLILTRRGADGDELLPPTGVGPAGTGGDQESMDAAFCPLDCTIVVGWQGWYDRLGIEGDSLEWWRFFSDPRPSDWITVKTAPDGTVWALTRHSNGWPADIVLYRFTADTGLTAFYPFGHSESLHWGFYDFDVDRFGNFHVLVGNDTCSLTYVRLDSTFTLQDGITLYSIPGGISNFARLGVNDQGQCLIVWWASLAEGPEWAIRNIAGDWEVSPSTFSIASSLGNVRVNAANDDRWIVTANRAQNMSVFTYGFPLSSATDSPTRVAARTLLVYPNPFNATTQIRFDLPHAGFVHLRVYDMTGRVVEDLAGRMFSAGTHSVIFDGSNRASGMYVVRMEATPTPLNPSVNGGRQTAVQKMVLMR